MFLQEINTIYTIQLSFSFLNTGYIVFHAHIILTQFTPHKFLEYFHRSMEVW